MSFGSSSSSFPFWFSSSVGSVVHLAVSKHFELVQHYVQAVHAHYCGCPVPPQKSVGTSRSSSCGVLEVHAKDGNFFGQFSDNMKCLMPSTLIQSGECKDRQSQNTKYSTKITN